jgi:hypothetical protein
MKDIIGGKGDGAQAARGPGRPEGPGGKGDAGRFSSLRHLPEPEDDVIRTVVEDVVRERTEKGLPVFKE